MDEIIEPGADVSIRLVKDRNGTIMVLIHDPDSSGEKVYRVDFHDVVAGVIVNHWHGSVDDNRVLWRMVIPHRG